MPFFSSGGFRRGPGQGERRVARKTAGAASALMINEHALITRLLNIPFHVGIEKGRGKEKARPKVDQSCVR